MNAEIISVGAEVISGDVSNTNASYLSQRLSRLGIRVTRHSAVDDRATSITEALSAAISRSHLVIFTGGLGPTDDDMTKEVVCNAVGFELVENEASMKRLVQ
ncbi:MAG: competence/damage-inducible protein A, partial [Clostridia bacterium]|nr:competence/damage-inducible protein A [Clostridia bacterium]